LQTPAFSTQIPQVSSSKNLQKIYEELVDHSKSTTWLLLKKLEQNSSFDTLPTAAKTDMVIKTTERDQKGSMFDDSSADKS